MTYLISDIHGEYDLFIKLLKKINFSQNDKMVICGDIIDKGTDSIKLIKFIRKQRNIYCILGNHEYSFLKYYYGLMRESSDNYDIVLEKLQEYFSNDKEILDWEDVDWLETLPFYIEEDCFICVHAGVPLDNLGNVLNLSCAKKELLVSDRYFKEPKVKPITKKCIFFGHTPTSYVSQTNKILKYKKENTLGESVKDFYKIHLDIGVWIHGVLGCICLENLNEYYVAK